jgi:hypothetical protein
MCVGRERPSPASRKGRRLSDEPTSDVRLELAYDAAQEMLSLQDATLTSTRTRANTLLATTALFISFSAGVGLINTDPDKGSVFCPGVAAVLLLVVVALGVSVLYVAWPANDWCWVPSASIIIQMTNAGDDESAIRRHVIDEMIKGAKANHSMLKNRQNAFRVAVALLVVEVVLLIGALALY